MLDALLSLWPHLVAAITLVVDVIASGHAVLRKRDARAAIAWVGFIWFVPFLGGLLYLWLGINRIQRRARTLRALHPASPLHPCEFRISSDDGVVRQLGEHLPQLARVVTNVTRHPLLSGNTVEPLDSRSAYDVMLAAIDAAERSIALETYIFDNDRAGRRFAEALSRAVSRGVEVRVIVDDIGAKYSWPSILTELRRARVPVEAFLPKLTPIGFAYANLCNHRKILVIDGRIGFTGGMNIREGHAADLLAPHPIEDLHFRLTGPVVAHLQHTFADDWQFCRGEALEGAAWFPTLTPTGPVLARGIPDGPDENFENLRMTILGGLASAQRSVRIVTPYFLPDPPLITMLNLTTMRGVEVDIFLPRVNNLKLVQWACMAQLWQVLERGCRVWLTPPPFDHTKLMLVDGAWTLLGSSNWDARSFRLNFEFNVECYDAPLAQALEERIQQKQARAHRLTLAEVDGRPLPIRLRDGVARLLSPYL